MKSAKNIILSILTIALLIGWPYSNVNACSCDTISYQDAVAYADEIFVGSIIKAEKFNNGTFINGSQKEEIQWDWRYHFKVTKKWKGNPDAELIIYHKGTSCDVWFDIYETEYLVYASKLDGQQPSGVTISSNNNTGRLSTWLCSRTIDNQAWEEGNWFDQDIAKLEKEFPQKVELKSRFNKQRLLFIVLIIIAMGFYLSRRIKR